MRTEDCTIIGLTALLCCSVIVHVLSYRQMERLNHKNPDTDTIYLDRKLTEDDIFTLALIGVESNYNNNAISEVGARGILQMMPRYVAEYNRLSGDMLNWVDVVNDIPLQLHVYRYLSADKSQEEIAKMHNPNAGYWYLKRIRLQADFIRRYEQVRAHVAERSGLQ